MNRLRGWLEIDHGVDFPALAYLHETIEQIHTDGEVTEEELDQLALAIERVLPKDVRLLTIAKRKQAREARRVAQRENKRQTMVDARAAKRAVRDAERTREGLLYKADFAIRGAYRHTEPELTTFVRTEPFLSSAAPAMRDEPVVATTKPVARSWCRAAIHS